MPEFANQSFLVTGAAGFIGSVVCRQLLEQGASVVGVDNLNDYYDVELKRWRLKEFASSQSFDFVELDIENQPALEKLFAANKFAGVINLAARAGVRYSMDNPHVYFTTNVMGSLNLLELCRQHQVGKYILASTSSLYAGQPMPFQESLPVNEPISPYAASKKAAEVMAYTYHRQFDIDVTVCRYFTVYGPAGRPDMSPFRFAKWIATGQPITLFGDGTQSRDFTYVDDIAAGTLLALKKVGFEVINLGGGNKPYSINEMIGKLEQLLGEKAQIENLPFHSADMKETWADIGKAQSILGWQPQVSFDAGLEKTVAWYRDNLPWTSSIPT